MDNYDEEMEKYVKDSRIACKYGRKCYQKNPDHHKKYKHPPKRRCDTDTNKNVKRQKTNDALGDDTQETNGDSKNKNLLNYFKPTPKQDTTEGNKSEEKPKDSTSASGSPEETKPREKSEKRALESFDKKEFIKEKFLVEMPEDFFTFWEFCKTLNPKDPQNAFADVDLLLVGPFDVLAEKFNGVDEKNPEEYLIHWRYYYDPPEFQTVLKGDDKRGYHIGYFRDSPDEKPAFLASNNADVDGVINVMGDNIFAAVNLYLEEYKRLAGPFKKLKVPKFQAAVKTEAEKLKLNLSARPPSVASRDKRVVTRTFNRAGLVVPYDRKTQLGYRQLALSNKELHSLLHKIKTCAPEQQTKFLSELQGVITNASIALDECDFGTGLELGWDIFFYGIDSLNATALRFLRDSYGLLKRDAFAVIAEAHVSNRRKGCNLSIL